MKATISTQITIEAHQTDVFEYLADLKYHHLWNPQVQRFSDNKRLSKGAEYSTESIVLGVKINANNLVTKFVPKKEIEITNTTGTVKYRATFQLRNKGSRTVVICTTTVSSNSKAFAFAEPILKRLARKELQSDLQGLKIAAENKLGQ